MSGPAALPGAELFIRNLSCWEEATCPGQLRCLGQIFLRNPGLKFAAQTLQLLLSASKLLHRRRKCCFWVSQILGPASNLLYRRRKCCFGASQILLLAPNLLHRRHKCCSWPPSHCTGVVESSLYECLAGHCQLVESSRRL